MKLTKAKIKAFEDEDREIIEQTEADIESGQLIEVFLTKAERRAIAKAAGEAAVRHSKLEAKASQAAVHVKTTTKAIPAKPTSKLVVRKSAR